MRVSVQLTPMMLFCSIPYIEYPVMFFGCMVVAGYARLCFWFYDISSQISHSYLLALVIATNLLFIIWIMICYIVIDFTKEAKAMKKQFKLNVPMYFDQSKLTMFVEHVVKPLYPDFNADEVTFFVGNINSKGKISFDGYVWIHRDRPPLVISKSFKECSDILQIKLD